MNLVDWRPDDLAKHDNAADPSLHGGGSARKSFMVLQAEAKRKYNKFNKMNTVEAVRFIQNGGDPGSSFDYNGRLYFRDKNSRNGVFYSDPTKVKVKPKRSRPGKRKLNAFMLLQVEAKRKYNTFSKMKNYERVRFIQNGGDPGSSFDYNGRMYFAHKNSKNGVFYRRKRRKEQ